MKIFTLKALKLFYRFLSHKNFKKLDKLARRKEVKFIGFYKVN